MLSCISTNTWELGALEWGLFVSLCCVLPPQPPPSIPPPTWYFSLFFSVLCSEVLSSSWPFSKLISGHYLVICYRLSIEECHVCCPLSLPFRSFSLTSPLLRWRASRPSTPSLSLSLSPKCWWTEKCKEVPRKGFEARASESGRKMLED